MKMSVKDLVLMAMYVALFAVLDYLGNMLGFLQMPNGGSISISIIPLLLASYHLGYKKGVLVSVLAVCLMFITGPMYTPDLLGFLLDYLIAFSVYGLAVLFPNYKYFYSGVLVAGVLRFALHVASGVVIWGLPWTGSAVYNAPYMIATTMLSLVLIPLIEPRLNVLFKK